MSKKWKPGESDKAKEIRSTLFQALIKHGMSDNRLDCLDFVFETLLVSASGCFAAGMTQEEALEFFEAALKDVFSTALLSTIPGLKGGVEA
jgi:dsDNA-binding SOS-regulon protein